MALLKVYNGASWDVAVAKVWDGAAWVEKCSFYDGADWQELYASTTYALNNVTNTAFNFGANAYSYWKADNNGNCYTKDNSGSWNQVQSSTDWVRPSTEAPGSSQIRHTAETGDTSWGVPPGALNAWLALSTDRSFYCYDSAPLFGIKEVVFTVELDGTGSSSADDTATITLRADREDF